ncbi:Tex family protein [Marinilabiliaceae bacterium ANBcel2]|nr:Tex family protein [Marinilabiliaceae bacterium ANBcel2]
MQHYFIDIIAKELSLSNEQIKNTVSLLSEGATIPFISRYRKEITGGMDEVAVATVKERLDKLEEIRKRRLYILETIKVQDKLTKDLESKIYSAHTLVELEDLYLPFKSKRKTRAVKAAESGLTPLADFIQQQDGGDLDSFVLRFLNDNVLDKKSALQGARDIIAERINEDRRVRETVRNLFRREAHIICSVVKGKEEEGIKFKDYFDYSEKASCSPSHRFLAMQRGANLGYLKVSISPDKNDALDIIKRFYIKGDNALTLQVEMAVEDAWKRLISPSIENEVTKEIREKKEQKAIDVFAENLRQLLLSSPLGRKRVLAVDPGYRTGCKVVCIDQFGNLEHNETIYPHPPQKEISQAKKKVSSLVDAYSIEAIAIGNGTASRETEAFIRKIRFNRDIQVFVVSEDGASVYSASKRAREEFPEYDVTVRGAVSIGRRLMDPLAELVKIDPKSIGVGQYQHDVDQGNLRRALDRVVESSVNLVGVDVNTASKDLLSYVSGLGETIAKNIVDYRKEYGGFNNRKEFLKVPRLGKRAFEQCAGFLRIAGGDNPLDNSAVHPESYFIVEEMAKDCGVTVKEFIDNESHRKRVDINRYVTDFIGIPTLTDIMKELDKPGRDPRSVIKVFEFSPEVRTVEDLKEGMKLPGIVTNITNFGAFVDVGVKQDGLVHISEMANRFVSDPNEIVSLHQHVTVTVIEVDPVRKRIQLSMK